MPANNDVISNALGIQPMNVEVEVVVEQVTEVAVPASNPATDDYQFARDNIRTLIEDGGVALDDMIDFAKQTQSPRAFEVVAVMIDRLVIANKELLSLSKKIKEIEAADGNKQPINNNLFVGSTADLQKMLAGLKDKDE